MSEELEQSEEITAADDAADEAAAEVEKDEADEAAQAADDAAKEAGEITQLSPAQIDELNKVGLYRIPDEKEESSNVMTEEDTATKMSLDRVELKRYSDGRFALSNKDGKQVSVPSDTLDRTLNDLFKKLGG